MLTSTSHMEGTPNTTTKKRLNLKTFAEIVLGINGLGLEKKPFNYRAFAAIVIGITAVGLPLSGLILHGYSDGRIEGDGHGWFMLHIVLGALFLVFSVWHIVLNRRPLFGYFKASKAKVLPFSREARWALLITAVFLALFATHSR